jgi:hypothetical protein
MMQFQFEFVNKGATRFNFRVNIKARNQEVERQMTYQQLREIDAVLKPYASAIFPQFKMWLNFFGQPQSSDLDKFRQVEFGSRLRSSLAAVV